MEYTGAKEYTYRCDDDDCAQIVRSSAKINFECPICCGHMKLISERNLIRTG